MAVSKGDMAVCHVVLELSLASSLKANDAFLGPLPGVQMLAC